MAKRSIHETVLSLLKYSEMPMASAEILRKIEGRITPRTLRRWLAELSSAGTISKIGKGRATRYQYLGEAHPPGLTSFDFLTGLDEDLKIALMGQLRDLWTHTSTALEGNTLSLGDTHYVLEQGLTIAGKPIREHQEVIGHARAIELLYQCLNQSLSAPIVFSLHRAIQTEQVTDIYKPNGVWKVEPNGTYAISPDDEQVFIEYALPTFVPALMEEVMQTLNGIEISDIKPGNAHVYYAKLHMGIVHVDPFWDGNGRMARLLANIPLLRAGLPPLVIPTEERRTYIQILANYQIALGPLTSGTGVWPNPALLSQFYDFCQSCYDSTRELVSAAMDVQKQR